MSSTLTTTLSLERDVPVTMRDGTTLAADVWRSAEPGPVLLQRTAYDKGELVVATHHAGLDPLRAVAAGFTVVIADVRGRHASAGTFTPFAHEAADGADTIAWAREQPFCDGRVCTYGTSYNGALQLLAADGGADALSVIEAASPFHDGMARIGGALSLSFLAAWAANDLAPPELARRAAAGADVAALAADLDARRRDPLGAARRLAAGDLGALGALVPGLAVLVGEGAAPGGASAFGPVSAPSLHVGGWHDVFLDATLAGFAAGGPNARLIVGPWAHGVTGSRVGAVDYGPDAPQALTDAQLGFFSAALDDRLDEVPRVRVFVMGADEWRTETAWPPARMTPQAFRLDPAAIAHDPAEPVPTTGGAIVCDPALGVPGPADRRALAARADVASTTGAPLPADLELMGPITATLNTETDAPAGEADWCVALVDVAPDGTALGICDGVARVRGGGTVTVRVGETAIVVPAGHRLRVDVAASNFPRIDVSPHAGERRLLAGSSVALPVTSGALS